MDLPYQRELRRFIHHPVTDMVIIFMILASVGLLIAEAYLDSRVQIIQARMLGDLLTAGFVAELSIRFAVAPKKRRFFARYWMDILAVLPLARPLRLLRVLYLLRLFRAGVLMNRRVSAFGGVMRNTMSEVWFMATLTSAFVLLGALVLDMHHNAVRLESGGFEGGAWYAVYTLIGGEPIGGVPADPLGRWVTLGLMLGGLVVFGVFVGTVSASMITLMSRRMEVRHMHLDELSDHVVICGWNRAGPAMLKELVADGSGRAVVVVTETAEEIDVHPGVPGFRPELFYQHRGDYTRVNVLEEVGISRASAAIILTDLSTPRGPQDQDARAVLAALTVERLHKGIFCAAQLNNEEPSELLRMAGVEEIVVGDWFTGTILGSISRNRGMVYVLHDILTTETGNAFHKVDVPKSLEGRTIGEIHGLLKERHNAILVSRERKAGIKVNPENSEQLEAGDVLVVIASGPVRLKGS